MMDIEDVIRQIKDLKGAEAQGALTFGGSSGHRLATFGSMTNMELLADLQARAETMQASMIMVSTLEESSVKKSMQYHLASDMLSAQRILRMISGSYLTRQMAYMQQSYTLVDPLVMDMHRTAQFQENTGSIMLQVAEAMRNFKPPGTKAPTKEESVSLPYDSMWMESHVKAAKAGKPAGNNGGRAPYVSGAARATPGDGYVCYTCGSTEHFQRQCPKNKDGNPPKRPRTEHRDRDKDRREDRAKDSKPRALTDGKTEKVERRRGEDNHPRDPSVSPD